MLDSLKGSSEPYVGKTREQVDLEASFRGKSS